MQEETRRALLVGILYRGTNFELGGCINDIVNVKEILITHYGYKTENILVLTENEEYLPTKANIYDGWNWLLSDEPAAKFKPGNVFSPRKNTHPRRLFFQYSGHGTQVKDINRDEDDGLDEAICPLDCEYNGMIIDDKIRSKFINKVGKNDCLVSIIDACHSESSFDLKYELKGTTNITKLPIGQINGKINSASLTKYTKVANSTYAPTTGAVLMISGCKDKETSADVTTQGQRQGALTCALMSVLEENKFDITCADLLDKASKYIKTNKLSNQNPCMSFGNSSDKFSMNSKFTL